MTGTPKVEKVTVGDKMYDSLTWVPAEPKNPVEDLLKKVGGKKDVF